MLRLISLLVLASCVMAGCGVKTEPIPYVVAYPNGSEKPPPPEKGKP